MSLARKEPVLWVFLRVTAHTTAFRHGHPFKSCPVWTEDVRGTCRLRNQTGSFRSTTELTHGTLSLAFLGTERGSGVDLKFPGARQEDKRAKRSVQVRGHSSDLFKSFDIQVCMPRGMSSGRTHTSLEGWWCSNSTSRVSLIPSVDYYVLVDFSQKEVMILNISILLKHPQLGISCPSSYLSYLPGWVKNWDFEWACGFL